MTLCGWVQGQMRFEFQFRDVLESVPIYNLTNVVVRGFDEIFQLSGCEN